MAKRKSGGGGIAGVVIVVLAMLATVPKEIWILLVLMAVVGVIVYYIVKKPPAATSRPATALPEQRPSPRLSDRYTPPAPRVMAYSGADEPVLVTEKASSPPAYQVPVAPAGYGEAKWIPPGTTVTVAGAALTGGLIYVGTSPKAAYGRSDPCVIDPAKSVAAHGDYTERQFGHWQGYAEISPAARRAYLKWLVDGKCDPEVEIGHVFLYFYGLERRAIIDAPKDPKAEDDLPLIAKELRRLLAIYGKDDVFRRAAADLLSWAELATYSGKLYLQPVPDFPKSWEVPLYLRLALGQAALDQVPLPAALALAWARLSPEIPLRTPATRCADQYAKLFQQKYTQAFGAGMVLRRNKTKLKFVYRPASSAFQGGTEVKLTFGDTPDVTVLTEPISKLNAISEAVTAELEAYSRYLGRNPEGEASLEGLLLLPANLWPDHVRQQMQDLKAHVDSSTVDYKLQDLLTRFDAKPPVTKDKIAGLAKALESMHIAMEPDVLGGAKTPKAEDPIVLFAIRPGESDDRATPTYQAAVLTLQLASAVALADGEIGAQERQQLNAQIEGWTHLTPGHQRRLRAHLRLLDWQPVSLATLKKKLEPLDAAARQAMAQFMAVVAQADGIVSPAELKMLEKIYKALGIDPKQVFSDVHAAAADTGSSVPSMLGTTAVPTKAGFQLDAARIAALQQDTAKVSALLANIFTEEPVASTPTPAPEVPETTTEESPPAQAQGLLGLDEAHTALVRMLLSRPEWSREELLDLASDMDLMLDGALERINEAAYDAHDMPITEGDGPVTINRDILEKEIA